MTQGTSNNLGKCTGGAEIEQVIFLFLADCSVEVSRGGGGGLSPNPPSPLVPTALLRKVAMKGGRLSKTSYCLA